MGRFTKIFPILNWLPNYKRTHLNNDVFAGLTVGVMLVPQGMAYALIAGLPPVYGLYAAIVPQIIYAILGTSRQLSVAPVAMDSLLVATGVSIFAVEGTGSYISYAILLAFMVGAFQFLLGLFKMGFITNLLSRPVISGFTSAAAVIIGLNQLKHLLGVEIERSNKIYEIVQNTFQQIGATHWVTFLLGLAGIIVIVLLKRASKRIPGSLLAVVLSVSAVYFFKLNEVGVSIITSIPGGLPTLVIPNFDLEKIGQLVPLALTISVIAFMESFSVAKAMESQNKDHKVMANKELIALGAANVFGSLFQAFPVAGGFSRSAVNNQSGAKTPISSLISAGLVVITLLFLTPLFYYLPHTILASIIMVAVSGLIDIAYPYRLWRENKLELLLLLGTFAVTLSISMLAGIATGVILSILLLLYKSANPHIAKLGRLKGQAEFRNVKRFTDLEVWENRLILRIDAPITFINIQYVKEYIERSVTDDNRIREVILDASAISHIDASATQGLMELIHSLKKRGVLLIMTDVVGPVRDILFRTQLLNEIGPENVYLNIQDAVDNRDGNSQYPNYDTALQHGEI